MDRKISELKKRNQVDGNKGLKDRDLLIAKLNEEFEKEASAMREKASAKTLKAEAEKEGLNDLNILFARQRKELKKEYNLRLKALQKQRAMELSEVGLAKKKKEAYKGEI